MTEAFRPFLNATYLPYYKSADGGLSMCDVVITSQKIGDIFDLIEDNELDIAGVELIECHRATDASEDIARDWLIDRGEKWLEDNDRYSRFPNFIEQFAGREAQKMHDDYWTSNDEWKRHKRSYAA